MRSPSSPTSLVPSSRVRDPRNPPDYSSLFSLLTQKSEDSPKFSSLKTLKSPGSSTSARRTLTCHSRCPPGGWSHIATVDPRPNLCLCMLWPQPRASCSLDGSLGLGGTRTEPGQAPPGHASLFLSLGSAPAQQVNLGIINKSP